MRAPSYSPQHERITTECYPSTFFFDQTFRSVREPSRVIGLFVVLGLSCVRGDTAIVASGRVDSVSTMWLVGYMAIGLSAIEHRCCQLSRVSVCHLACSRLRLASFVPFHRRN